MPKKGTLDEILRDFNKKQEELRSKRTAAQNELRDLLGDEDPEKITDENMTKGEAKQEEIDNLTVEIKSNDKKIALYKSAKAGTPAKDPEPGTEGGQRQLSGREQELRSAQNKYLRGKKSEFRADAEASGLVSEDVGVTIPEDIAYNPEQEINTVTDLSKFINVIPVKTASGKYPVAKKVTDSLPTVKELEENPKLAKPQFEDVSWDVDTFRGALGISQESIDDSVIDLVGFVGRQAAEKKINTKNVRIANALKAFAAKTISNENVDELKKIINVELDVAYKRDLVVTQSFYNFLDTLKDKNGQYLLKPAISESSPERLLGLNVHVIEDTLLGLPGEAHAWVGDLKRAVLMANRKDLQITWANNDVYSKDLVAILRFGITTADANAGYFLTLGTTPADDGNGEPQSLTVPEIKAALTAAEVEFDDKAKKPELLALAEANGIETEK